MTLQEQATNQAVLGAEEEALKELAIKIVHAAIVDRASDIHIDPAAKESKVRFRIDGVMQEVLTLPKNVHGPLTNRFKILSDLDTENRRTVQDGRFDLYHDEKLFSVRECALPSYWGEKLTMRIQPQHYETPDLTRMGYRPADKERIETALSRPSGMLLFSGPTGSGKTTTEYAAVKHLVDPEIVILTIEDPIEVSFPGVIQVQVNRKQGMTFASILRGMLRSDPDVIMVGNIPNLETAETAFQAAILGHFVITQLHAMDAVASIQRLLDMGIEPFMIGQGLVAVSSQRLVRRVCVNCKAPAEYPARVVGEVFARAQAGGLAWPKETPAFYKGTGCDICRGSGYRGRLGIYEVMLLDTELASMISDHVAPAEIGKAAVAKGMTTMLADGIYKAMEGQTTLDEVMRVLQVAL